MKEFKYTNESFLPLRHSRRASLTNFIRSLFFLWQLESCRRTWGCCKWAQVGKKAKGSWAAPAPEWPQEPGSDHPLSWALLRPLLKFWISFGPLCPKKLWGAGVYPELMRPRQRLSDSRSAASAALPALPLRLCSVCRKTSLPSGDLFSTTKKPLPKRAGTEILCCKEWEAHGRQDWTTHSLLGATRVVAEWLCGIPGDPGVTS